MGCTSLLTPLGTTLYYCGPSHHDGPLPAFFYFALAGDESLTLSPYNHPVLPFEKQAIRVFSFTLPSHGPGFDKFHAMEDWLSRLQRGESFLTTFFDQVLQNIEWLICSEIVMADHMAIGGLSRGGFIATHLAAREKRFHTLLGFAPLTRLKTLSKSIVDLDSSLLQRMESLNLLSLVPSLLHLRHVRFYIGNRDSLVDTDECYHFIRRLADEAHEKHVRHCHVELFLTPSIGNKGHGTAQHTFEEGAAWIQHHLQRAGER